MRTKNAQKHVILTYKCDLFSTLLEVVEVHVRAKSRQDECCGLWVIVFTEKKLI